VGNTKYNHHQGSFPHKAAGQASLKKGGEFNAEQPPLPSPEGETGAKQPNATTPRAASRTKLWDRPF